MRGSAVRSGALLTRLLLLYQMLRAAERAARNPPPACGAAPSRWPPSRAPTFPPSAKRSAQAVRAISPGGERCAPGSAKSALRTASGAQALKGPLASWCCSRWSISATCRPRWIEGSIAGRCPACRPMPAAETGGSSRASMPPCGASTGGAQQRDAHAPSARAQPSFPRDAQRPPKSASPGAPSLGIAIAGHRRHTSPRPSLTAARGGTGCRPSSPPSCASAHAAARQQGLARLRPGGRLWAHRPGRPRRPAVGRRPVGRAMPRAPPHNAGNPPGASAPDVEGVPLLAPVLAERAANQARAAVRDAHSGSSSLGVLMAPSPGQALAV